MSRRGDVVARRPARAGPTPCHPPSWYGRAVHAPLWLTVLLTCLATHRVTRLLTRDQLPLVAWPRERVVLFCDPRLAEKTTLEWHARRTGGRAPRPHGGGLGRSVAYLITCDWCVSVYVSAGLVTAEWYLTDWYGEWPLAALVGASASTVTGLISQREPD